jgi:hypothetical protein
MTDARLWRAGLKAMRLFCDEVEAVLDERRVREETGRGDRVSSRPALDQLIAPDTLFSQRRKEWDSLLNDTRGQDLLFYGEHVMSSNRGSSLPFLLKPSYVSFSNAFIGMAGSGKTEAMRMAVTYHMCANKSRLYVVDGFETGAWDVFQKAGARIARTQKSINDMIDEVYKIGQSRLLEMKEHGCKNVRELELVTKEKIPSILLVIDDLSMVEGLRNFDDREYNTSSGSLAAKFFNIMTRGRSSGIRLLYGTQFAAHKSMSAIDKNVVSRIVFKVASAGEASMWLDGEKPYWFGKGMLMRKDGTVDRQEGHACVDRCSNHVAFWLMNDDEIAAELAKHA